MIAEEAAPANSKKKIVTVIVNQLFNCPQLLDSVLSDFRQETFKLARTINACQRHLTYDCGAESLDLTRVEQVLSALAPSTRHRVKAQLKHLQTLTHTLTKMVTRLLSGHPVRQLRHRRH